MFMFPSSVSLSNSSTVRCSSGFPSSILLKTAGTLSGVRFCLFAIHPALLIFRQYHESGVDFRHFSFRKITPSVGEVRYASLVRKSIRSEEHTSELQSRQY